MTKHGKYSKINLMDKALRYILYALLLTPMFFLSIFLFPFITTKVLYLRLLVEAAFFIYLILALKHPELAPRWNLITVSVWVYMAVVFLTSLFGVNFGKSFWGTVERGEGIITLLHLAVYFTILPAVFRSQKDWFNYLLAAVSVMALNALYGVAQILNFSFVIHGGASRVSGTIGNAAFFAAYMLFGIFFSIYLLNQKQFAVGKTKIYLWAVLALELFVLYHSQTRGAIVALGVTILIYALIQIFRGRSRSVKLASAAGIVLIILAGLALYVGRNSEFVRSRNTLNRLATISTKDITTQSRFDTWRASWNGWQDRFFIGYGYENYNIAFNKYFPARIYKDQGSQIWFDRAHNIIFDVAVTGGILGLISYLGIFAVSGYYLLKLRRQHPEVLILGLGLLAYFIQNIFVFDTHATHLMFYLILAHLVFLGAPSPLSPSPPEADGEGKGGGFFTKSITAVLIFILAYFINFQPAFANIYTTEAIKATKFRQYREIKGLFERSLSYGTYMDEEIRQRAVDYVGETANSGQLTPQEQREFYQYVVLEMRKSIEESPLDVKNYLFLMNVLNRFSNDPASLDEVLRLGERALALSPTRPHIYWELGQAYFSKKDQEKGLEQFRIAIELNPEPKESHLNYLLAGAVASRDDIVESEMKIIQNNYELTSQEYLAIGRAYARGGNNQKVIEFVKRAVELDPANADTRARLAAAYAEACDIENARLEVEEVIALDPSFEQEGAVFLSQLAQKCGK